MWPNNLDPGAKSAGKNSLSPFFELRKTAVVFDLGDDFARISREFFTDLIIPVLRRVRFDAEFYRQAYSDLADAEARSIITDLHEHYLRFGYFEDRLPCKVEVDGAFYAREYPDVAIAILENRVPSAQAHFETAGFREGRLPSRGWSFADLLLP